MKRAALGPGREFDTIRAIVGTGAGKDRGRPWIRVGPGDDAAVLDGEFPVLSTDLSIEDVHFRRAWMTPEEIGYRAAMAALSDLAAMGAGARAVLASLAGTEADAEDGTLARAGTGVGRAAREVGAELVGGDVTRSPGPLVVDVTVVGEAAEPWLRSGARPGHELWVTGALGGAAGGIRGLVGGRELPAALRERVVRPRARIREALWLRETGLIRAAVDLSDGLLPDAGHLAAASGARMTLEEDRVPVDPALDGWASPGDSRAFALAGGEDYELLLAAEPGLSGQAAAFEAATGCTLRRVGRVTEGEGVALLDRDGRPVEDLPRGFTHFRGAAP